VYLQVGEIEKACADFTKACELGECSTFEMFQDDEFCAFTYLAMADM
jgi:hypothetical protein